MTFHINGFGSQEAGVFLLLYQLIHPLGNKSTFDYHVLHAFYVFWDGQWLGMAHVPEMAGAEGFQEVDNHFSGAAFHLDQFAI